MENIKFCMLNVASLLLAKIKLLIIHLLYTSIAPCALPLHTVHATKTKSPVCLVVEGVVCSQKLHII